MVNSMIPWIGGKRLMREFLIARFPPHYDKYVEAVSYTHLTLPTTERV